MENLKNPWRWQFDSSVRVPPSPARDLATLVASSTPLPVFSEQTCYSCFLYCRIMPRMDRQHVRVISGIILLIVIRCSYCQDFATDAPKDTQFIEGTSTTHEANGAENSPSLGMTVSKMCTLKVLWPFLQRVRGWFTLPCIQVYVGVKKGENT